MSNYEFKKSKLERNIAFFGNSPFQIMSVINIALSYHNNDKKYLFIVDNIKSDQIKTINQIKNTGLFEKIFIIKRYKMKLKVNYGIKTLFFPLKAILQQIPNFDSKLIFDEIYCTDCNSIMCSLYLYTIKKNPSLVLHLIEDGARNYCHQNDNYALLRKVAKIFNKKIYPDYFKDTIVFEPKLIHPTKLKIIQQPLFKNNSYVCKITSSIYKNQFIQNEISINDVIYFDQPLGNELEFLEISSKISEIMKKVVPNQHLKYKCHPNIDPIVTNVNKIKSFVWEPYFIDQDELIDSLILIGISSTTLFSMKILFNREPTVIFLYKLFSNYFMQDKSMESICFLDNSFDEAVKRLKHLYRDPSKVIVVENFDDLFTTLSL